MRTQTVFRRLLGASMAIAIGATASAASAQAKGIALDRFDPAPAGDRMFGVPSPYAAGDLTPHLMLLGDYAHNPLVLRYESSRNNVGLIVSNQFFLHVDAGLSLWKRLFINLDLPLALVQDGQSPQVGGLSFSSPTSAQVGDLRAGLRVRLFGEYDDPFQLAVGGYVWFPTGAKDSFVGDGKVRGLPQLILGGHTDRVVYSAAVGPELRAAEAIGDLKLGSMLKWGAGVGFLLGDERHLQIGAEASGAVNFRDVQKRTTNAEILADIRYRPVSDIELGLGLGPGLTSGVGTPDFRGVMMVAYTPEQTRDRDRDGILDDVDACPDTPGVHNDDPHKNGCPLPKDRDGDGIPDDVDACPDVKGVADADPHKNGCPPDRDGDGIVDAEDACPDVKGVASTDPKKNGCPPPTDRDGDKIFDDVDACPDVKGVASDDPKKNGCPPPVDTDGDGIFDDEDACPNEKGVRHSDPKKNGCPKAVRVSETEIFILEQVQFDTAKSTIKKVSDPLLDEVSGVLKEHPEILKIEVQGHTDNRGSAALNRSLSAARADAVMKALVKRGIDKKRLTAKGYGPDKPIATNDNEEGRQKNRRVQFTILEKKPRAPR